MRRRLAQVLTTMALAMFVVAPPALAGGDNGGGDGDHDGKKRKCVKHFTSSETNPYNFLWLPKNAGLKHKENHGDKIFWEVKSKEACKAKDKKKV